MWAAVPQASWRREGRQALPQANSGAAGQKAPLRDFQHPHGVLCPSAMSALLGSRACDRPLFVPPGDREVTPPARKHPSQSRATAKKEVTWLSSGWRGRASCLSRHGCRLFPGTALWKANSPQRVGGEHLPGGLAGWATADSTPQALLSAWLLEQRAAKCPCSQGRPGFCRGCGAPPRPGSGRESDVRGGSGALKHPSVPSCVGNYATTPVRGVGAGCRAAALSGGSPANTNKPGHMHKSTRIGSFLACKGL